MQTAKDVADQFLGEVDSLFSMYCSSLCTFHFARFFLDDWIEKNPKLINDTIGLTTENMLNEHHFLFQVEIQGDVFQATTREGKIQHFTARAVIVWLYEMWEIKYRQAFASAHGVEREKIRSNLFSDLRHFRHCIIHKQAIADKKVSEDLVLLPLQPIGEELLISILGMTCVFQYAKRTIHHLVDSRVESFLREDNKNFTLDYHDLSQNKPAWALSYPDGDITA